MPNLESGNPLGAGLPMLRIGITRLGRAATADPSSVDPGGATLPGPAPHDQQVPGAGFFRDRTFPFGATMGLKRQLPTSLLPHPPLKKRMQKLAAI